MMGGNLHTIGLYKACIYKALERIPLHTMMAAIAVGLVCPHKIDMTGSQRRSFVSDSLNWTSCYNELTRYRIDIGSSSLTISNIQCCDNFSPGAFTDLKPMINRKAL